jgi:hypothetical protein
MKLSNAMHQKSQSSINEKNILTQVYIGKNNICGTNVLIGAIGTPSSDCVLWIIFKIFSEKVYNFVFNL